VVSYRLIDDAAGCKPPSIQEATTGNRESGKSSNNATRSWSGLNGGEPISDGDQDDGQPQTDSGHAQGIPTDKHPAQYRTERRVQAVT